MKKHLCVTILFAVIGIAATFAQGLNFGLKGGVNNSNYAGTSPSFDAESITSYHAGVFLELGLSERLSLQPELLYSTLGAEVSLDGAVEDFKNKLGYISIPILARIYLIPNRLSLDLGPQVSFLMNEKENVNLRNSNSFDFAISGGVTLQVIGPLFIQGRYNLGLTDVKPDASVTNRVIQLSAGLRF
ncbi:PorT family protein [Algoriphagus sp. AGSA1]|uniref:porin family protein n=1 Tax=Algoriphagus sp. AGSA1 TaxID=2907213 RepID=UPI001F1EC4F6|nr:porin family protein [Algoriphagus sp. AGSA1]MCE7054265.1 PorT family protein [Algoriphagus sp. AGSA1]